MHQGSKLKEKKRSKIGASIEEFRVVMLIQDLEILMGRRLHIRVALIVLLWSDLETRTGQICQVVAIKA